MVRYVEPHRLPDLAEGPLQTDAYETHNLPCDFPVEPRFGTKFTLVILTVRESSQ